MRTFSQKSDQLRTNPAAKTALSTRSLFSRHDDNTPQHSDSAARHIEKYSRARLEHDFSQIPVRRSLPGVLEAGPITPNDPMLGYHPRLNNYQEVDANRSAMQPEGSSRSAMHAERGLKPNAQPDEVVRGRTVGEFVGDVARPVGTAIGNVFGAVVGALTGVSISSNTNTGPTWNNHGAFDWQVAFSTSGKNGWIVQEVNNGFRAKNAAGGAIANPFTPHYFEAWAVDAAGNVSPSVGGTNDFWTNPDFKAGLGATEGHWSTTSSMYFTTTDPATQSFIRNNPATNAGILLSSTSAPAGLGLGIARLHRYAQGTWDSTGAVPTHTGSAGP